GRRLRSLLHPPAGARPGHGWPRGALPGRGQRNTARAGDGVHGRAGDLSARTVRRADRGRLPDDRPGRRGAEPSPREILTPGANPGLAPASVAELLSESNDPIQRLGDVVRRRRVAQARPAIIPERRARDERDARGRDQPRAKVRAARAAERIYAEKEVERAQR